MVYFMRNNLAIVTIHNYTNLKPLDCFQSSWLAVILILELNKLELLFIGTYILLLHGSEVVLKHL